MENVKSKKAQYLLVKVSLICLVILILFNIVKGIPQNINNVIDWLTLNMFVLLCRSIINSLLPSYAIRVKKTVLVLVTAFSISIVYMALGHSLLYSNQQSFERDNKVLNISFNSTLNIPVKIDKAIPLEKDLSKRIDWDNINTKKINRSDKILYKVKAPYSIISDNSIPPTSVAVIYRAFNVVPFITIVETMPINE